MTLTRTLDWRPRFDPRSLNFRLKAVRGKIRRATWRHGPVLDQGVEGACVGFAAAHNLQSTRRAVHLGTNGTAIARAIYRYAQTIDEWDGADYEGTSVLAGMKALRDRGAVIRYEWATSLDDVLWALSWRGPVQIGVPWHSGMFDTDDQGFIHAIGGVVGGHSVLLSALDPLGKTVTVTNSWGTGWGRAGQALLSFEDLQKVLAHGEAVSILKVKPTPGALTLPR